MEEERDFVVLTDDNGNEFELDVVGYFDYKDNEYAVLMDLKAADEESAEAYVMQIVYHEETDEEEFVPVPEEMLDEVIAAAEEAMECDDDECGCGCGDDCGDDCDCDDDGCDCRHPDDFDCGCHD